MCANKKISMFIHIPFENFNNTEDMIFLKFKKKLIRTKTKLLQKHQNIAELQAGEQYYIVYVPAKKQFDLTRSNLDPVRPNKI